MKIAAAIAAFVLVCACSTAPQRVFTIDTNELVGCYKNSSNSSDGSLLLKLQADGTYVAYTMTTLDVWAKASSSWSWLAEGIVFDQPKETQGWHHYLSPFAVYRANDRIYLQLGQERFEQFPVSACGF